ncbi:GNAT family N-acetyltransferase [Paenibacillus humicus]|uniref:GNAT family N-acetyltransferase n=1 Tax=Paenibacillus humicus TaxID=412861 RepID=UPI000FD7826C|nr:GNAT family N-acetyltransferase [Paenibacillus humicus]
MNIRSLSESDAHAYQQLRLNGLQSSPEAYVSSYEQEAKFPLEFYKELLKPTPDKFVLGAFVNNTLFGMVTFMRDTGLKDAHKGNIYGMYVAPELRGHGMAKALMLELIHKARKIDGVEQLKLAVVSENEAARNLYESLGFEVYGVEKNALKHNGVYSDGIWMALRLAH